VDIRKLLPEPWSTTTAVSNIRTLLSAAQFQADNLLSATSDQLKMLLNPEALAHVMGETREPALIHAVSMLTEGIQRTSALKVTCILCFAANFEMAVVPAAIQGHSYQQDLCCKV
jgi:hypothetical protein